jgi:hypothetical protein
MAIHIDPAKMSTATKTIAIATPNGQLPPRASTRPEISATAPATAI